MLHKQPTQTEYPMMNHRVISDDQNIFANRGRDNIFLMSLSLYLVISAVSMAILPKDFPIDGIVLSMVFLIFGTIFVKNRFFLFCFAGIAYAIALIDWTYFHVIDIEFATLNFSFLLIQCAIGLHYAKRLLSGTYLDINGIGYFFGKVIILPIAVAIIGMTISEWLIHDGTLEGLSRHFSHFLSKSFGIGLVVAILFPIVFSNGHPRLLWLAKEIIPRALIAAISIAVTFFIFSEQNSLGYELAPLSFLLLPIIIWSAFRLDNRFNSYLVGIISIVTVSTDFIHNGSAFLVELSFVTTSIYLLICQFLSLSIQSQRTEIQNKSDTIEDNIEELKLYETVFNESGPTIIVFDDNWITHDVNKSWEQHTGYSKSEAIGFTSDLISSGAHPQDFYSNLWAQLYDKGYWKGECCLKRKDGSIYYELKTITSLGLDPKKSQMYVSMGIDITKQKLLAQELEFRSTHDGPTALFNRLGFSQEFATNSYRYDGRHCAFFLMDIDNFKHINDVYGHDFGEKIVMEVGLAAQLIFNKSAIVGRFGPDEIGVFDRFDSTDNAIALAKELLQKYNNPILVDDKLVDIGLSIGIAFNDGTPNILDPSISNAYDAHRVAKEAGKHTYSVYQERKAVDSARVLWLQNHLHVAIENSQFRLEYQPKISLELGQTVGYEALLRWSLPEKGNISPGEFIPVAEQNGLIRNIDYWVVEAVCRQISNWQSQDLIIHKVAINIAGSTIMSDDFIDNMSAIITRNNIDARWIELEFTERMLMTNDDKMLNKLDQLSRIGFSFSIDDFGTGYSNLGYIANFPVDKIKIDISFVRNIHMHPKKRGIVKAIIDLAHTLDMKTVAEGVELAEEAALLKSLGCDQVQGFYYSKPLTPLALLRYLGNETNELSGSPESRQQQG